MAPDLQAIEITEGDELRFTCTATGIPQPSIEIKVPEGSNVHATRPLHAPARAGHGIERAEATIAHFGIQRSQAGLYQCIAINEAGQDLRYIQVNVKEKRGDVGKLSWNQILNRRTSSNKI